MLLHLLVTIGVFWASIFANPVTFSGVAKDRLDAQMKPLDELLSSNFAGRVKVYDADEVTISKRDIIAKYEGTPLGL